MSKYYLRGQTHWLPKEEWKALLYKNMIEDRKREIQKWRYLNEFEKQGNLTKRKPFPEEEASNNIDYELAQEQEDVGFRSVPRLRITPKGRKAIKFHYPQQYKGTYALHPRKKLSFKSRKHGAFAGQHTRLRPGTVYTGRDSNEPNIGYFSMRDQLAYSGARQFLQ